jgi:predicted nucleic acid-binding protein
MNVRFADTFYFLASINDRDQYAKQVAAFDENFHGDLVTTDFILMEVADALSNSDIRGIFRAYCMELRNSSSCEVVEASRELFDRALNEYHRHLDKDWSLTDCTSFIVMQDRGIKEALTGDKHFEQAGFVALLK